MNKAIYCITTCEGLFLLRCYLVFFFYYLIHLCNDCVCVVMSAILYWLFGCPVENLAQMKILMSMLRAIEAVNNKYSINYISMFNLRAIMITKNEKKKYLYIDVLTNGQRFSFVFHFVSFRLIWFQLFRFGLCVKMSGENRNVFLMMHTCKRAPLNLYWCNTAITCDDWIRATNQWGTLQKSIH